jgi:leucyl/phenylalanyl-tRNA---protein transferase
MTIRQKLTPELLISAYQQGFFPMADEFDGKILWHSPDPRAIIPLDKIKTPRSLKQFLKNYSIDFRINSNFHYVIRKCADRNDTWISDEIVKAYIDFHNFGFAHSVEAYMNGEIVGGLYGVTLGGAFFGESMFSDISNASKAAFYFLAYRLMERGFVLLDSQYINPHTESLGAIEIPKWAYLKILNRAITLPCNLV